MKGILILEGADCTGKTTLARNLIERHDAVYLHHGYFPGTNWTARYLASVRRAARLAHAGRLVVIDRCWLSQDAYGTVYRGGSEGARCGRLVHRVALKHAAVTVLCAPPVETTVKMHRRLRQERTEMYESVQRIAQWYDRLAWRVGEPTRRCYGELLAENTGSLGFWNTPLARFQVYYNWELSTASRVSDVLEFSLAQALKTQLPAALDPGELNFGGHLMTAKALLIGDAPSPQAGGIVWPFVTVHENGHGGCSAWLAEQLNRAGLYEEELVWTNAYGPGQTCFVAAALEARPDLQVVALGTRARQYLRALGLPCHLELMHPRHHKRFNRHDMTYLDPLVALLKKEKEHELD